LEGNTGVAGGVGKAGGFWILKKSKLRKLKAIIVVILRCRERGARPSANVEDVEEKTRLFGRVVSPDQVPNSEFQSKSLVGAHSQYIKKYEETELFVFYTYGGGSSFPPKNIFKIESATQKSSETRSRNPKWGRTDFLWHCKAVHDISALSAAHLLGRARRKCRDCRANPNRRLNVEISVPSC
jgi:hypothetical protein